MIRSAEISACQRYRYSLQRVWSEKSLWLNVCMFTPSRADAGRDDPTILTLIGFAKAWGYGGLEVINLRAWRASRPRDLFAAEADGLDTVGGFNMQFWLRAAGRARAWNDSILVGWGNNAPKADVDEFLETIGPDIQLICLGRTAAGAPIHPSARGTHRIPRDRLPIIYREKGFRS